MSPYQEGRLARDNELAFLSNPYGYMTVGWQDWRQGWLSRDRALGNPAFHRRVA